ncbi:MAG: glycosyltransferase family 2 protein [bacterium]|nr:glycosyltransferase family 2 protein [bacterium]
MPTLSIIVPARNEEKYIEKIVQRVLAVSFPCEYELVFVEGHSKDKTVEEVRRVAEEYKNKMNIRYATQDGIGKADAIWKGFSISNNDILMILDADLTVQPEDLPKFYQAVAVGSDIFVNGSRLVYPMEKGAMRPLNYLGNKFFAILLSLITHQKMTDTLCGTKVIYKSQFQKIKDSGLIEKLADPFCDFTLILGAKLLGLRIIEVPVVYKKRIYDGTKIRRFRDGWKLLKICLKYSLHT